MTDLKYGEAAVVALGGNLPGTFASCALLLDAAVQRLAQEGLQVLARSGWWRSAAWPDPMLPPYLNGVVLARTEQEPLNLLEVLRRVERDFGRQEGPRNAARTLDLDLIALGRRIVSTPALTLPHPRAAERLFVMGPLAQIAPAWRHPVTGETAASLAGAATVGRDAAPIHPY